MREFLLRRWLLAAAAGLLWLAGCDSCRKKDAPKTGTAESANANDGANANRPADRPGARTPSDPRPGDGATPAGSLPLPADADAVLEIHIGQFRKLPVWPAIERRLMAEPYRRFIDLLKKHCGLDPLAHMDHILVGVRFETTDGLAMVKGRFKFAKKTADCLPKMARQAKVSEVTIRSVTSHGLSGADVRFGNTPPVRFTLLDDDRFALSAGGWLDAAATLAGGKTPRLDSKSHIFNVRRTLGTANLGWIVFLGIPPGVKQVLPSMAAVARVRTIGGAVDRKDGSVAVRVVLDMRQPKSAEGLSGMLKSVLPQLKKLRPAFVQFDPFLQKIQIRARGPLLQAEAELSDAEIGRLYRILTFILKKYMSVPRAGRTKARKKTRTPRAP